MRGERQMAALGEYHERAWEPLGDEQCAEIWARLASRGVLDANICRDCTGLFQIDGMSIQHLIVNGEGLYYPTLVLCCTQCGKLTFYNTNLLGL